MADKKRRRSLRIFYPRSDTPDSAVGLSSTPSPTETRSQMPAENNPSVGDGSSPRVRQRPLTKTSNRNSMFGSFRSLHSLGEDEKALVKSDSKSSSFHDETDSPSRGMFGNNVKRSAELQVTGTSIFKKRTQYMVLSESHLIRFKSQAKATEMFPIIPHGGKSSLPRTMSSISSYTDMQTSAYMDITQGMPLEEIIAVYRIEDGRPYFTIEVSSLDVTGRRPSSLQLCLSTPKEVEAWSTAIRENAMNVRSQSANNFPQKTLEYLARTLDNDRDYDPLHFRVFKVVQRFSVRPAGRTQNDDLSKHNSSVCYLVIGVNKVHLIPISRGSTSSSSIAPTDLRTSLSFGITNITSIIVQDRDDAFELYYRTPLRQPYVASLASHEASQIALWLRYASEYIRPEWSVQPFAFRVPAGVEDQMDPPTFPAEDNGCFDRTLIAFCSAFEVASSRIYYSVDFDCEDAPCFRLLPSTGFDYSTMELLAVFRALRYNETFASISFANIDLGPLRNIYDPFADPEDALCTRSGMLLDIPDHASLSLLHQELRALALKSRKLRRFDFTNSLKLAAGKSSGIPEALTPLCKKSWTNVDWITLTGIRLSDHDVDFLVDAASERQCHLRALEIGECGLSVHDVDVLLSTLGVHDNTMEVLDISNTQGRFSPELFQRAIGAFSRIRRLNLTRVQKTAGPEPLIAPEILLSWRLEVLHLNGTALNEQSVDAISGYLASPKSDLLRELHVNQCNLTGKDLAIFFQSMTRQAGVARNMHVSASENRLGSGISLLCKCIANDFGPASMTMRMIDFEKEYQFRELVSALAQNTTIKSLDVSQASLPYDASMETCESLKDMFALNCTLEELDISGDVGHLDATRFGIGLNVALTGLERNKALKMLRIEHQNLGLQGANTLAGVIEKNRALLEIHCEHNDINLQSFTVLVNALKKNTTLLFIPEHATDRARSLEKVKEEFDELEKQDEPKSPQNGMLKKSFHAVTTRHRRHSSTMSNTSTKSFTQQDVQDTIRTLDERWTSQIDRLQQYLSRNYQLASGVTWDELDIKAEGHVRPTTADSLSRLLSQVNFDSARLGVDVNCVDTPIDMDEKQRAVFQLPHDGD